MSVEEARASVIETFGWYDNCCGEWRWNSGRGRDDPFEPERDAALDRLILEVKAEMPCYRDDHCGRLCSTIAQGSPWTCQACQARAELARPLARGADPTWETQWGDPVPIDEGQMVIESP